MQAHDVSVDLRRHDLWLGEVPLQCPGGGNRVQPPVWRAQCDSRSGAAGRTPGGGGTTLQKRVPGPPIKLKRKRRSSPHGWSWRRCEEAASHRSTLRETHHQWDSSARDEQLYGGSSWRRAAWDLTHKEGGLDAIKTRRVGASTRLKCHSRGQSQMSRACPLRKGDMAIRLWAMRNERPWGESNVTWRLEGPMSSSKQAIARQRGVFCAVHAEAI
jgi:hypothetical protein